MTNAFICVNKNRDARNTGLTKLPRRALVLRKLDVCPGATLFSA